MRKVSSISIYLFGCEVEMLAIIVLNYNDWHTTEIFVKMVIEYESIDKIIIVDNCSTDDSFEHLQKLADFNRIHCIISPKNYGYAGGNNYGVKYAIEKFNPTYICVSNPDIIVKDKSIRNIIMFIQNKADVGIVSGLIHNPNMTIAKNFAWRLPTFFSSISAFLLTQYFRQILYHKSVMKRRETANGINYSKVDVILGCFFVIKAKVFQQINFFDERTFLYGEEDILAYNLKMQGFKNYILLDETIIHNHSTSINKSLSLQSVKDQYSLDSSMLFLSEYLKVSKFGLCIYKFFTKLHFKEMNFIQRFRRISHL